MTESKISLNNVLNKLDSNGACLISGSAMSLGYYPFSLGWLNWFLLIPLLIACEKADPLERLKRSAFFSFGYFVLGISWLIITLHQQVHLNWAISLLLEIFLAGALALAPISFCWLSGYLKYSRGMSLLWLPALWVFSEDIRFQAFGGGPWLSLGLSQIDTPLAGYFPIVGESGVSGITVLMSILLLMFFSKISNPISLLRRLIPIAAAAFILFVGHLLQHYQWTQPSAATIPVAIVQSATTQHDKLNNINQQQRLELLQKLSLPLVAKTKLIIWPETVVTLKKNTIKKILSRLNIEAQQNKTTLLIGAFEPGLNQKLFNTAFTLGFNGDQVYRKRHLVPLGENVPSNLRFLVPFVPGDEFRDTSQSSKPLTINKQLMGVTICWEGSFNRDVTPLVNQGASVIINVANEAWFARTQLPYQNLDSMRVRAVETGRNVIRVANFGPGAIIDENGMIIVGLDANHAGVSTATIQPRAGLTPFMRLGADYILLLAFIAICTIIIINISYKKFS